jgi:phthalate 4,5-dioxygenase oxygenase subunit
VPADDVTTTVFNFIYSADPDIAMPLAFAIEYEGEDGRGPDQLLPDGRLKANAHNNYLIDRERQKTGNFTGIEGINTQDVAIQDGMGTIVDRSKEHLGSTDRAIVTMRRLLLEAIKTVESGGMPKGADTDSYRNARAVDRIVDVSLVDDTLERESITRF